MTTAQHAIAVAEQVRVDGDIFRYANGYVSIQQAPPYSGDNDRFQDWYVDHCGISVAYVLTKAGLRFGIDYPDTMQYSPWLSKDLLTKGYAQSSPQPGDIGVIDWAGAGWGATAYADHIVLIVDTSEYEQGFVTCWETNTTPDGKPYYYRRATSLFVAWGTPKYAAAPIPEPEPEPVPPPALISLLTQTQEADVAQIIDIYDPETGAVKFHMMNVGGVVSPTTGPYADEDNGFTRVRIALPDWEAREKEQLRQLDTLRRYFNETPAVTQ